ncbi:hypothetical protein GGI05_006450, partial [Coemansia sp. RSA 2603]
AAVSLCDYEPLQRCLKANSGDRSKCMKEWKEFQEACQQKKRAQKGSSECEACKAPPQEPSD